MYIYNVKQEFPKQTLGLLMFTEQTLYTNENTIQLLSTIHAFFNTTYLCRAFLCFLIASS
jgi:hypothetical protein